MRTHLLFSFCFLFFFSPNEGKTLHLTYQSKRIFNSGSRFCSLGPSVIRTECELMEMLVWIFNKLSLPILIQSRKPHISASRNFQTEKRCFPSRVQASPVHSNKEQNDSSPQQHETPSQSCWSVNYGAQSEALKSLEGRTQNSKHWEKHLYLIW